jgi:nucleotide-binding universal stress UspA family protein
MIARENDGTILLAHASEPLNPITPPEVVWYDQFTTQESGQRPEETRLERIAEDLKAEQFRVRTFSCVGPVKEEILGVARREEADLIVMGTHARTGLSRLFLGSETESLFRQASCPIMVVGPEVRPAPAGSWAPRKILCASDLGPTSVPTVVYAHRLGQEFGAEVSILHIDDSNGMVSKEYLRSRFEAALAPYLIGESKLNFLHRVLMIGYAVGSTIADVAFEQGSDIIVMGAHAASARKTHLQSGIVPQVMAKAPCPVMVQPK